MHAAVTLTLLVAVCGKTEKPIIKGRDVSQPRVTRSWRNRAVEPVKPPAPQVVQGPAGPQGLQGPVGPQGLPGQDGKSGRVSDDELAAIVASVKQYVDDRLKSTRDDVANVCAAQDDLTKRVDAIMAALKQLREHEFQAELIGLDGSTQRTVTFGFDKALKIRLVPVK